MYIIFDVAKKVSSETISGVRGAWPYWIARGRLDVPEQ
jgi:hypothetical protein